MIDMPEPTSKADVQRMLGVLNYFGKFVQRLSERTALLRDLIKCRSDFQWTENHAKEWKNVTQVLTTAPVLAIFDARRDTKITCDASRNRVGAALLQRHYVEWQPVAYASRVLAQAEQRYAQIEKEALGICFGCEKFHQFVYGRQLLIETDHKPLLSIAEKAIDDMPPRLQRFFLRLFMYDFSLQYIPGKNLVLADMLSRSTADGSSSSSRQDTGMDEVEIHAVESLGYMVTPTTQRELQRNCVRRLSASHGAKSVKGTTSGR
uniref:RNA-directed DNA polymerase n=1 Tax=Amblyomma triste TaxID=251400 RepID=A0A023GFA7_AMBTT